MKKLIFFNVFILFSLAGFNQQITEIKFNHERGFYFKKFKLKITCNNSDARIKYTVGGYNIMSDSAVIYSKPILIDTTRVLKAGAFIGDSLISNVEVHSFIFPKEVIKQPFEITNYPNKLYPLDSRKTNFEFADFEMDPEIVNHPAYKDSIVPALLSIPTVSVVLPSADFHLFYNGEESVKTSIEVIYPENGFNSEQVFCGIKGHSHLSMKRSMRVLFKKEFGPANFKSNILKTGALNSENATTKFDQLVFRAGNNRSWTREPNQGESTFTRDQWFRDSQILLSGDGSHGTFSHLYINGIYMGLYNIIERPDENFLNDYYGGKKNKWISLSHADNGEEKRLLKKQITKLLLIRNSKKFSPHQIYKYVDLKNYCDYIILKWYSAMGDYLYNNWWAGTYSGNSGKLKFFIWDNEVSFEYDMSPDLTVYNEFSSNYNGQSLLLKIWDGIKTNEEFMLYFADRVYKHCFNGWLSPEEASNNWWKLKKQIRLAIIAESARWGDALYDPPKTRDKEWLGEVNRVDSILKMRNVEFVNILKGFNFYPKIDPPEITILEKTEKEIIIQLKKHDPNGDILYTTNGKDPRSENGKTNIDAKISKLDSLTLTANVGLVIKTRFKKNNAWSALNELPILFDNKISNFKITEIMYLPDSTENVDEKNFEFLEFQNTGAEPIDISGIHINDGIKFTVPEPTFLYPGQYYILAENATLFNQRYGFEPDGIYRGKLNNESESISIYTRQGKLMMKINYLSKEYNQPHGISGYSIIPKKSIHDDYSNPINWKRSPYKNGTPGKADN